MTLEELGLVIKEKREAAGLTLDDVAGRIKISTRILRTIEEGSTVGLPHAVYTKSFIRSFGQIVGYDQQELNTALEAIFPPDAFDESKTESILHANPAMSYPDAGKRFAFMLVALLIVAGLIAGGWYVTTNYGSQIVDVVKAPFSALTSPDEAEQAAPSGDAPESLSGVPRSFSSIVAQTAFPRTGPPTGPPSALSAPHADDSPAFAGVDASGTGGTGQAPASREDESSLPADTAAPDRETRADAVEPISLDPPAVNAEASIPGGKNTLVVRASADCWISSRADGRYREYMVRAGSSFAITYNDRLEMTFGNAGGVSVAHNGVDLGTPGNRGQVAFLRFPEQAR